MEEGRMRDKANPKAMYTSTHSRAGILQICKNPLHTLPLSVTFSLVTPGVNSMYIPTAILKLHRTWMLTYMNAASHTHTHTHTHAHLHSHH